MDSVQLVGRLKLAKPTDMRVFEADRPEPTLVHISAKRDKWAKATITLEAMNWHRLDLLDAQGRTIESITSDETAADSDDEKNATAEALMAESEEGRWLMLMINAQRLALENNASMLRPLIDGYVSLTTTFGDRLSAMEKRYDQMLDTAYQNAILQAQIDTEPDGDAAVVHEFIQAWRDKKKVGGKKPAKALPPKGEGSNGTGQ